MNRPLVSPYGSHGWGPTIFDRPVVFCPSMPPVGPSANSIVFGEGPDYFAVRRVPSSEFVQMFSEARNFAENDLVGFQSFARCDASVVVPNASFAPFTVLQQHS